MMDERNAEPRIQLGWKLRTLLILSLAFNLLVVGLLVGALIGRAGNGDDRVLARGAIPVPLLMSIEAGDRKDLVRQMRDRVGRNDGIRDARDRARRLLEEIRSDQFDEETVRGLFAEQRAAGNKRQENGAAILAAYLSELSTEERRAYADRLERNLRRGFRN